MEPPLAPHRRGTTRRFLVRLVLALLVGLAVLPTEGRAQARLREVPGPTRFLSEDHPESLAVTFVDGADPSAGGHDLVDVAGKIFPFEDKDLRGAGRRTVGRTMVCVHRYSFQAARSCLSRPHNIS